MGRRLRWGGTWLKRVKRARQFIFSGEINVSYGIALEPCQALFAVRSTFLGVPADIHRTYIS
jgi:hypothetical protein